METAIRCCPDALTRRDDRLGMYPTMYLMFIVYRVLTIKVVCNVKAASFVHIFVQLAIEFNSLPNEERGGLVTENENGRNTLQCFMFSSHSSFDEEHHQRVLKIRQPFTKR